MDRLEKRSKSVERPGGCCWFDLSANRARPSSSVGSTALDAPGSRLLDFGSSVGLCCCYLAKPTTSPAMDQLKSLFEGKIVSLASLKGRAIYLRGLAIDSDLRLMLIHPRRTTKVNDWPIASVKRSSSWEQ